MLKRAMIVATSFALLTACDKSAEKPVELAQTAAQTAAQNEQQPEPPQTVAEEAPAGQWVESETYGVRFRVPQDWKVSSGEATMSATSPDETITVLLVGTQGDGVLSTALESIKKEVEFKDLKLEKDGQTVLNGLPGHHASGSAVLVQEEGDQGIQFMLNAVQAGDKGVALMVFAEAEMYEARREELIGLSKTLQPRK